MRAIAPVLAVVGLLVGAAIDPAAAQGPIKLGFLSPLSGAIAQAGKDMYSGCELYWQESGWRIGDRKLEVILEDTEGQPATAVSKLRKLIDSDRVNVLAGVILSNVAYALVPPIEAAGIPTIYPINSADDLTQRKRPKWIIRTGFSAGGNMHPFGEYAFKTLKYRKIVTIGLDYAFGWETVGGFQKSFEDNGGQVIQKLWVPLNVQDYAPYLAQVKRDADAVFVVALGRWSVLFAKQYADSGLKERIPLIAGGTYTDEHVLSQLGDETIGVISAHHYSAALETPANRKFRAAFEKAYSRTPSFYSEDCYTGAQVLAAAVKAMNGRVEDRPGLMAALRRVEITDAPRGPVKLDVYGNPTQNIYIRRVERVGGVLQNTVIYTYPAVGQFWTYDPQKFLEQPVYSREFPLCRHC
ncbi:MAG TPA: ABC transporter substrate-binding protein [Candidatus Dormibacteraeota bacterium]|nr:ABC transporter substrate-binding protein [Candidatus Dormibacteraeota bacterium]